MKNNNFLPNFLYSDLEEREKALTVNSQKTVQPVALMRLGVFVPKPSRTTPTASVVDASEMLANLDIARAEGFDDIKIIGPRLDMDTDFKVWIAIIHSFSIYGLSSNKIRLKFSEFAGYAGFSSKRLTKQLRESVHMSLQRLRSKTLSFRRSSGTTASYNTGLLKVGYFDSEADVVELEADEKLWELYSDYRVLLQQQALKALPKKEVAQALYTFIESLPTKPAPVAFARLRERLALTSQVKDQNRVIKKAIEQLIEIDYLEADIQKKGKENYLLIHKRNPKLKL